ncbi:hypothetical protein [Natronosalvus halobius]|uniref:hypothetical protein n=1 Tax=Natronosalvus halobius TaxID=2953746 RepID=UPI0020A11854|nr:hypothetical protein [Natronosalvus halobius]USZ73247.1 hypothetical protein NGM15_08105 [Natronosalvus halobius]
MSDDDHQQARDERAWSTALEVPEEGDGKGKETTDEVEQNVIEQAEDQPEGPDEGGEATDEEVSEMVSQEEYQQQQAESTSKTGSSEADDKEVREAIEQADDQGEDGLLPSVGSAVPELSPMTTFVIICGVFAAIVIWRVYRARSEDEPVLEEAVDEENETRSQTTGLTMIEQ